MTTEGTTIDDDDDSDDDGKEEAGAAVNWIFLWIFMYFLESARHYLLFIHIGPIRTCACSSNVHMSIPDPYVTSRHPGSWMPKYN
jgi:hypothetical protein